MTTRDNFFWLLAGLVFLLFSGALVAQLQLPYGEDLVNLSLLITLLVGVWSMDIGEKKMRSLKIVVSVWLFSLMAADSFLFDDSSLRNAQLISAIAFMSLTIWQAWRAIMFSGPVDSNKIVGAICIYLLLGFVWALAYLLVESYFPGSLRGFKDAHWQENLAGVTYFSMVTLTSLGYGDITPQLPIARFLAYMETITGMFFIAILVASLIGVRLANNTPGQNQEKNAN